MDEAAARTWDAILKTVGLVGLALSGGWTYYTYRQDRAADMERQKQAAIRDEDTRKKELNAFIFQKQAAFYFDVADAAATIATSKDQKEVERAKARFDALYAGDALVVEDRRVESAMVTFHFCVIEKSDPCARSMFGNVLDKTVNPVDNPAPLKLAAELSGCIRSALQQDRQIDFGTLTKLVGSDCPYL